MIPSNTRTNTTYHVELLLTYKAEPGIQICCIGRIPELSMWDKTKPIAWMKRGEGDKWVLEKPLVTNQFYFTYKFALFDAQRKFLHYEKGIDRICDAEVMEEAPSKYGHEFYNYQSGKNFQTEPAKQTIKRIELNLGWQVFRVIFSVSYPIDDPNNNMTMLGGTGTQHGT